MRRVAILVAVTAISGVISNGGPASAAGVSGGAYWTQCAVATGSIPGGFATANACFDNGSSVTGTLPNAPTVSTPQAFGCIALVNPAGFTYGCGQIPTSGVSVDPLLASGSLNFSIPSSTDAGVLTASITMTGTGQSQFGLGAGPYVTGTPSVPTVTAAGSANLFLFRPIEVNPGSVVSSTTIGGGILDDDQGGGMSQGLSAGIGITAP